MTEDWAQEVAEDFATLVGQELKARGLRSFARDPLDLREKADWRESWYFPAEHRLFQVTLTIPYKTVVMEAPRASRRGLFLTPWAVEFACKLARPFPIEFYGLELPRNVTAKGIAAAEDTIVRFVVDYFIGTDEIVMRFDSLVKWQG